MTDTSPSEVAQLQWSSFLASVPSSSQVALGLYGSSLGLLRDAIVAFHAGALGASVVACRASIEAAGYSALCSVRTGTGMYAFRYPFNLSGKIRRVSFAEIKSALVERKMLDQALIKRVGEVQDHGDFIAHLAPEQAAEVLELLKTPSSEEPKWMRLWVSHEETGRHIETAEAVFRALLEWSARQPIEPVPA
jgi:hypothetical protein